MIGKSVSHRNVIQKIGKGAMGVACVVLLFGFSANAQDEPSFPPAPDEVSSIALLAGTEEPGERLVIRGKVYHADGKRPYGGFVIYLYQTDATGRYNRENGSWREPRLQGWVKTTRDGSYEIQTIKPGSYPGSRNPAHIHAIVKPPEQAPRWIDDFLFDDDPFLTDRLRRESDGKGKFANIMRLTRGSDESLIGTRDIAIGE